MPILLSLIEICGNEEVLNSTMMTLNGKLNHYMYLVPGGCWQRSFLIKMQDSRESPNKKFEVTEEARTQANWWIQNLRAAQKESSILDPRKHHRMDSVSIYSDAAGGDSLKLKNGTKGFSLPKSW